MRCRQASGVGWRSGLGCGACLDVDKCICDGACVVRSCSSCCTDLRFVCSVVFVCVRRRVVHCDVGVFIGGCKLILNARWCGFEQVRLSVAFSRGCAATRVTFVSMCRKQACVSVERASTHMALDGQVAWLGALLGCFGRGASALCVSRVAC